MENPYASPPHVVEEEATPTCKSTRPFCKALFRWTAVCFISAIPSFFWGCTLGNAPEHLLAMFAGIACFALGYALIECSAVYQSYSQNLQVRRTLKIGYGARLAASIFFPFGLYLDMFVGIFSVNAANWLFGTNLVRDKEQGIFAFASFFVTTVMQGLLMNVLLFAFMAIVFGAQWVWIYRIVQPHPETAASEATGTL